MSTPTPTSTPGATDPTSTAGVDAPTPAELERLRDRLVVAAASADLLDVGYTTTDSPYGPLLLAATRQGLVRLAFAREDHDAVLARLAARVSPRVLRAPGRLDGVRRQLDEYFAGTRREFAVDVDLQLSSGYRRTVLDHLRGLPYGRTESYTEVARATASPRAVRAVGSACATNPVPVVVPCHRVLRSDGSLGGYVGGLEVKTSLLALEAGAGVEGYRQHHR
ncbi:methylated-DNA-[protein]-cysteine S-methyltransferase [Friedmanniella luteola]|uniref:Methylated-DNA--protein-cysteine methyltransferase n=1 Tax=Friedmanniella luteola TaxID=546871 RepID=A0A1H1ZB10_9ACTN|nr:methylated-DNA--[protein]-cysteine S-methyltransferase [Friedmanniella luteola]SDT30823.1 methylated-DNA-[protein]-cysteine S-methyltransferase [Friedmanniella luteola]